MTRKLEKLQVDVEDFHLNKEAMAYIRGGGTNESSQESTSTGSNTDTTTVLYVDCVETCRSTTYQC